MDIHTDHVTADGLRIHYARAGTPSELAPVVLVHGFLSSHHGFRRILGPLAAHREVFAPDLPGFGASEQPDPGDAPYDRAFFARSVLAFADAIGLSRFVLVGHSMGGAIAQEVALAAPDRVERLVLVNSLGTAAPLSARLADIPVLGPLLFGLFFMVVQLLAAITRSAPVSCARRVALATLQRTIVPVARAAERLRGLRVPTSLVWGERDGVFPVRLARRLQRLIPGAVLHLIPRAGHFPAEQAPRQLLERLLRLLHGR